MGGRIKHVQAVCQYAYGVEPVLQSVTVCVDIHSIRQTAHDEHIWAKLFKRPAEVVDDILSVGCAMACANNRHDATLVEVGIAAIEKYDWGIVAVAHSFWIIVACHRQWTNGMCVIKF